MMNDYCQIKVDAAYSGDEAIKMMKTRYSCLVHQPYKIVFMDINMPSMDGIETTKRLRKIEEKHKGDNLNGEYNGIIIIGNSAGFDSIQMSEHKAKGFSYFIPKPIPIDLVKTIFTRDDL